MPTAPSVRSRQISWVIVVLVAGMLFWQQGSWGQFQVTQTWGELRNENWRDAVAWLNERRGERSYVLVESGLIEGRSGLQRDEDADLWQQYFRYPVLGPYQLESTKSIPSLVDAVFVPYDVQDADVRRSKHWLLTRSNENLIGIFVDRSWGRVLELHRFRGVTVCEFEYTPK